MWNLPLPDKDTKDWYLNTFAKQVADNLKEVNAADRGVYREVLLPNVNRDIIDKLLTLEPEASLKLCESRMDMLMKKLHKGGYDSAELPEFRKVKNKKSARDTKEDELYQKYHEVLDNLHKVFDYKGMISSKADRSYELSKRKHAKTCTYCGREYIYTVEELSEEDKVKQVARPDFDHWLSHELYPMLAMNYCNLIPCCPICNRSVKGTKLMKIGENRS